MVFVSDNYHFRYKHTRSNYSFYAILYTPSTRFLIEFSHCASISYFFTLPAIKVLLVPKVSFYLQVLSAFLIQSHIIWLIPRLQPGKISFLFSLYVAHPDISKIFCPLSLSACKLFVPVGTEKATTFLW